MHLHTYNINNKKLLLYYDDNRIWHWKKNTLITPCFLRFNYIFLSPSCFYKTALPFAVSLALS